MGILNPVIFKHKNRLAYVFSEKLGVFKGYGEKIHKKENLIKKIDNCKLYWTYFDEFNPQTINTGLDRRISQNYPSITFIDDKFILNFIGQQIQKNVGVTNFLYQMEGLDIENLQPADNTFVYTKAGCMTGNNLNFFKKNKLHFHSSNDFQACALSPFRLQSITSVTGHELVVLNGDYGENRGSFLYDFKENVVVGQIIVDKKIVQAASMLGDELFYLEDEIVKNTKDFSIEETDLFFTDPASSNYDERFFSILKFEKLNTQQLRMLTDEPCDFVQEIGITSTCCLRCSGNGCVIPSCDGEINTTIDGVFAVDLVVDGYEYNFYLNGSPAPYDAVAEEEICLTVEAIGSQSRTCYTISCTLADCASETPIFMLSVDRTSLVPNPIALVQNKKLKKLKAKYIS